MAVIRSSSLLVAIFALATLALHGCDTKPGSVSKEPGRSASTGDFAPHPSPAAPFSPAPMPSDDEEEEPCSCGELRCGVGETCAAEDPPCRCGTRCNEGAAMALGAYYGYFTPRCALPCSETEPCPRADEICVDDPGADGGVCLPEVSGGVSAWSAVLAPSGGDFSINDVTSVDFEVETGGEKRDLVMGLGGFTENRPTGDLVQINFLDMGMSLGLLAQFNFDADRFGPGKYVYDPGAGEDRMRVYLYASRRGQGYEQFAMVQRAELEVEEPGAFLHCAAPGCPRARGKNIRLEAIGLMPLDADAMIGLPDSGGDVQLPLNGFSRMGAGNELIERLERVQEVMK